MALILDGTNGIDSSGVIVAPDGSVTAPAITNSGDTNTGIYFSAADTVDVATNGTQRGQFDSSGNFKFNSGYGSVATAYGCRAWVNFDGTGTVAIRASGNVTSITDNGNGDYTVNFTNSMPDSNFCVTALSDVGATNYLMANIYSYTTSSAQVKFKQTAATSYDVTYANVSVFR